MSVIYLCIYLSFSLASLSLSLYLYFSLSLSLCGFALSLSLTLSPSSLHVVEMLEMLMMRRCSCRGVACVHANSVAINVPDPDDPDMDPVYRTESNVIHFRLSSPQRFVVACFATTAAFGLIILLVESKMNWNWLDKVLVASGSASSGRGTAQRCWQGWCGQPSCSCYSSPLPRQPFLYVRRCIDFRAPASTPPCSCTLASPAF